MLQDSDASFRNLYGIQDWRLEGAACGGLGGTNQDLLERGATAIIDEIKKSHLRGRAGRAFTPAS